MTTEFIRIDRQGPVLEVTLARPEKANALTYTMLCRLNEVLVEAAGDKSVHALVITGAGERVFCAGADLSELSTDPNDSKSKIWDDVAESLAALPIVSVAMINGACIGGGMTLALGCDLRIGAPSSRFSYPALKNGVIPGDIDAARLQALLGPSRSAMLLLGGQSVDGETAFSWGLLDRIEDRASLRDAVAEALTAACKADRDHVVRMKRIYRGETP